MTCYEAYVSKNRLLYMDLKFKFRGQPHMGIHGVGNDCIPFGPMVLPIILLSSI